MARKTLIYWSFLCTISLALGCAAIHDYPESGSDSDINTDADGDAGTDGDSDTDADADSDSAEGTGEVEGSDPEPAASGFLRREGRHLFLGDKPFHAMAMNKFDLFYQFSGSASNSPVSVTRPQALTALDDAVDAGVCCMRVSAFPFYPSQAGVWENDRDAYFTAFDDMLNEGRVRGLRIIPVLYWNIWTFADLAGEPLGRGLASGSQTRALMEEIADEMTSRYAQEEAILFWELTNELNLHAELDHGKRTDAGIAVSLGTPAARSAADNFTSAEIGSFVGEMAAYIKATDPNHLVGTGFGSPRPSAWHLYHRPEWSAQGADWTADSPEDLANYVALTNPDSIDLVSVHMYNGISRLGLEVGDPEEIVYLQAAADAIERPLYIGEFGDARPPVSVDRTANFTRRIMLKAFEQRVPLSLVWAWEFYQFGPNQPSPHSIEPGVDTDLIAAYSEINAWLNAASHKRSLPLFVPTPGMEIDDGHGEVEGWETTWRNGSSTGWSARRHVDASAFQGSATLRLNSGVGDPDSFVYALSEPVAVKGGGDLVASAAMWRHRSEQPVSFTIIEENAAGDTLAAHHIDFCDPEEDGYRVSYQRASLKAETRQVRLRFGAGGAESTIVDVDDVRVFRVEP